MLVGRIKRLVALTALCTCCVSPVRALGPVRDRIYNPPTAQLSLSNLTAEAELLRVTTSDGLLLTGISIPPRSKPVLLFLHGSGASASDVAEWLKPVSDSGYGLVVAEYRGFSGNPGKPERKGLLADAQAFLDAAKAAYPASPIVLVGHSLGGGVAFDLALGNVADTLVTIGAFPSLAAVAPPLARPFITDRFDNVAALTKLDPGVTYFLLHGSADDVIPPGFANDLHNAAVRSKRNGATLILKGQPHRPDAKLLASALDYALAVAAGRAATLPVGVGLATYR